jgi:glycosyltransferase involved in cell wall biosynthesis
MFPFHGEYFLNDELKILATYFEKIIIIPIQINDNIPDNINEIELPDNVKLQFIKNDFYLKLKIAFTYDFWLYFIKSIIFSNEKIRHFSATAFRNLLYKFSIAYKLKNLLKKNKFKSKETFFYSYWYSYAGSALIIYDQIFENIHYGIRTHGIDYDENQFFGKKFIYFHRDFEMMKIKNIFCISNYNKNYILNKYPNTKGNIQVFRLGTHDFGLQKFNRMPNCISILSISSLIPIKRVHLIIECLSTLKNIKVTWIHYGDGPLADNLKSTANRILPNNVSFQFKGFVNNTKMKNEIKNQYFDFMFHFSKMEGVPVSIMDSLSFGIPVVACNVGGVSEIVNNQVGLLLEINFNINTVAQYINEYIKKPDSEIINLRNNAREFWKKNYNAAENYKIFAEKISCAE